MSKKIVVSELDDETSKNFGKVMDWLYEKVAGNKNISSDDKERINKAYAEKAYDGVGIDIVNAKSSKFMNLNILSSNFGVFEDLALWPVVYDSCILQTKAVLAN